MAVWPGVPEVGLEVSERTAGPSDQELNKADRYELLADPAYRRVVAERTEHLIDLMVADGVDTLFFLDKSARPISWLFRDLWHRKHPDASVPAVYFFDIDIRAVHRSNHRFSRTKYWAMVERLRQTYSGLAAAKKIVVVDEYLEIGESLFLATLLLQDAVADAPVYGYEITSGPARWAGEEEGFTWNRLEPVAPDEADNRAPWQNSEPPSWYGIPGIGGVVSRRSHAEPLSRPNPRRSRWHTYLNRQMIQAKSPREMMQIAKADQYDLRQEISALGEQFWEMRLGEQRLDSQLEIQPLRD